MHNYSPPYLLNVFHYSKVIVDITSTAFLFEEFLPTLAREVSFTVELHYGTVYHQSLLRLPNCLYLSICILIPNFPFFVLFIVYVL